MPKFLEDKLKKEYGKDSSIPYAIMNKLGFMHGNKETSKGKEAEEKHEKKKTKDMSQGRLDDKTKGEMIQKVTKKR